MFLSVGWQAQRAKRDEMPLISCTKKLDFLAWMRGAVKFLLIHLNNKQKRMEETDNKQMNE